jgi:hypothetical protein
MNMCFTYTIKYPVLLSIITDASFLGSPSRRWAGFADVFPKNTDSAENWIGLFIAKETAQ